MTQTDTPPTPARAARGIPVVRVPRSLRPRGVPARAERWCGALVVAAAVLASLLVPLLSSQGVDDLATDPMTPPSAGHLFGTDTLGRDVFVRVFAAMSIDVGIALVAVLVCVLVGSLIGVVIGLCGRVMRETLLRVIDAVLAIPYMILVLGIVAVSVRYPLVPLLSPSIGAILIALVVTGWASYARLTAVQTQVIRQRESVVAARVLGYGPIRILARHVLPEALRPSVSLAASHAVLSVAITASLAFLGAGVQAPTPELGVIMHEGVEVLSVAWWVAVFPGLAVLVLGVGFMLIADSFDEKASR